MIWPEPASHPDPLIAGLLFFRFQPYPVKGAGEGKGRPSAARLQFTAPRRRRFVPGAVEADVSGCISAS